MINSHLYKNTGTSATVHTGPGKVHTVTLAAGSDAATLILYDNTAASGTVIWKLAAAQNTSASAVLDVSFGKGCHAALTGTSPSASVSYTPG